MDSAPWIHRSALLPSRRKFSKRLGNASECFLPPACNLLTMSWELIVAYCNQTGQYGKLLAEPWHEFFRIIRNSLSHDFRFNLPRARKTQKLITGTWNGRTLRNRTTVSSFQCLFSVGLNRNWIKKIVQLKSSANPVFCG